MCVSMIGDFDAALATAAEAVKRKCRRFTGGIMSHDTGLMPVFGGIEAGGTKFVCGIGTGPEDLERTQFPTTTPDLTIARAIEFFRGNRVDALGIASFGPIDIATGFITSTPK